MSKEYVILKGVNNKYSRYATDATLEAEYNVDPSLNTYYEYKGLFFKPEHQLVSEGENTTFASGFKTSNNKHRVQILLRSYPITYPSSSINYEDFWNDSDGNNLYDVINSKYLWIQNDHTANGSDSRFNLVPTSEASYLTKNRDIALVSINPVAETGGGGTYYYLEVVVEYASR